METTRIINGEYCLSVSAIVNAIGSEDTVWTGLSRNRDGLQSWTHYPDPDDSRKKWIVYSSLPELTKSKIDSTYGDIESLYWSQQFIDKLQVFIHAEDASYSISIYAQDTEAFIRSCAFLRMLACEVLRDSFITDQEYYTHALKALTLDKSIGLKITNARILKRKVQAFRADGPQSLIHRLHGNSNRNKITELGKQFIINCYASPLKPSIRKVTQLYNAEAANREDWKIVSEERVRQILNSPEVKQLAFLGRHGVMASKNLFERTIKRRKPSRPDALWSLDGSPIQLRYQHDGAILSDLYAVTVMDAYSSKIVGYKIGKTENAILVQGALRAACRQTLQRPDQLQYDNGSANKSAEAQQLFKSVSNLAFPCAPYNAKAKPIEAIWGATERKIMHGLPNFKGGNITSPSLDIKANPDFLNSIELPGRDAAIAQAELVILTWNNTAGDDGRTPNERYHDFAEDRKPMDFQTMINAFWVLRKHSARYTKDGITIEVAGKRYTYEVESERGIEDRRFRKKYLGSSFEIKYDPESLDKIALYFEGNFAAVATRKYEAPMARIDMEDGEGHIILKSLSERKRSLAEKYEELKQMQEELEEAGLPGELDFTILNKDAFNRMERKQLDDILERTAIKPVLKNKTEPVTPFRGSIYDIDDEPEFKIID